MTLPTHSADRDKVPDITGRLKFNIGTGNYSVQVLARNIRVDSAAAPAAVADKWGGAVGIAGLIPVLGNDDVRFDLNAGNAIGRYQELGFFPDGFVNSAGKIELADHFAVGY